MTTRKRKKTKPKWSQVRREITPESFLQGIPICEDCHAGTPLRKLKVCVDCYETRELGSYYEEGDHS